VEAAAEASSVEAGMSKPATEAAAESTVPTPATAPPAAPAPANGDPGPTPAPSPAWPTPGRGRPTPGRVPPSPARVPSPAWVPTAASTPRRCRRRISGIALRRPCDCRRRISRVGLRIAGVNLGRGRLRKRPDGQSDCGKSCCRNGNSPEPTARGENEHNPLRPGKPGNKWTTCYMYMPFRLSSSPRLLPFRSV
jgi:hypothetical protein